MSRLALVAFLLVSTPVMVMAQAATDPNVKAAIYDIGRAEQQLKGAQPNQASKLARISRMLDSAKQQLDGSSQTNKPEWQKANARLQHVAAQLQALNAPQTGPGSGALPAADLAILKDIDGRTDSLAKDLARYGKKDFLIYKDLLNGKIADLKQRYAGLTQQAHPQAIAVAQKVIALEQTINAAVAQGTPATGGAQGVEARLA